MAVMEGWRVPPPNVPATRVGPNVKQGLGRVIPKGGGPVPRRDRIGGSSRLPIRRGGVRRGTEARGRPEEGEHRGYADARRIWGDRREEPQDQRQNGSSPRAGKWSSYGTTPLTQINDDGEGTINLGYTASDGSSLSWVDDRPPGEIPPQGQGPDFAEQGISGIQGVLNLQTGNTRLPENPTVSAPIVSTPVLPPQVAGPAMLPRSGSGLVPAADLALKTGSAFSEPSFSTLDVGLPGGSSGGGSGASGGSWSAGGGGSAAGGGGSTGASSGADVVRLGGSLNLNQFGYYTTGRA